MPRSKTLFGGGRNRTVLVLFKCLEDRLERGEQLVLGEALGADNIGRKRPVIKG